MPKQQKSRFLFTPTHKSLEEILIDRNLAAIGDAYTNLIYSLYLSLKTGKPTGERADNHILAQASKNSGLKELLPSRAGRHGQANAAEALLVYAWLRGSTTIRESVEMMIKQKNVVEAFSSLLSNSKKKLAL